MLNNHFANSPSVGSHEYNSTNEELHSRIQQLEQRLYNTERQETPPEPKPKKIRFGKIRKFFKDVIKPILIFIPAFLIALTGFMKKATA